MQGPWWLEKSHYCTDLQKRQEGQSVELQAAQPQFGPWENQEAIPLHNTAYTHKGEEGKWEQSTWI